jgi:hypothetical protein
LNFSLKGLSSIQKYNWTIKTFYPASVLDFLAVNTFGKTEKWVVLNCGVWRDSLRGRSERILKISGSPDLSTQPIFCFV